MIAGSKAPRSATQSRRRAAFLKNIAFPIGEPVGKFLNQLVVAVHALASDFATHMPGRPEMDFNVREYTEGGFEVDNISGDQVIVITKGDCLQMTRMHYVGGTQSEVVGFEQVRLAKGVAYGQGGSRWRLPAELALWILKDLAGIPQK